MISGYGTLEQSHNKKTESTPSSRHFGAGPIPKFCLLDRGGAGSVVGTSGYNWVRAPLQIA